MLWLLRKLPLLAALLGLLAALAWIDADKDLKHFLYPAYSLHNSADSGCSLAFRYVKDSRGASAPAVRELNRMVDFAELERDAVVVRIAPAQKPGDSPDEDEDPNKSGKKTAGKKSKSGAKKKSIPKVPPADKPLLTDGETAWIRGGGRLVLALDKNYGPIEAVYLPQTSTIEKTFPDFPDVAALRPTESRTLKSAALDNAHTLFTLNGGIFAARLPVGDGDVILLASARIFANDSLGKDDNLKFLASLAPATRAVYFDEYLHGMGDTPGVVELLTRWGLGAALLILGVDCLFLFWRARTPVGPPEDAHRETRTQAIDFVGSLAPMYNRALQPHEALALHYKNFVQLLSARSGLRGDALSEKIRALLGNADLGKLAGQRQLAHGEFDALLARLNDAYGRLERAHSL